MIGKYWSYGIGLMVIVFLACAKTKGEALTKHSDKIFGKDTLEKIDIVRVRADSMSISYLSKAVYDSAIFYNNLPLKEKSYKLNEIRPVFIYAGLKKVFDSVQFTKPIPMKEVTWEYNEEDVVTVWYSGESEKWLPVDVYQYGKNTKF